MPSDDPRKSQRLGLRLTEDQYAHLSALRDATGKSISALVNRALTLLTIEQVHDWMVEEEAHMILPADVGRHLVIETVKLSQEATELQHRVTIPYLEQEPLSKAHIYRAVRRTSQHLSQVTYTLASWHNGNGGHSP